MPIFTGGGAEKFQARLNACTPVSRRLNRRASRPCRLPHRRTLPPPVRGERHRRPARGLLDGTEARGPPSISCFRIHSRRIIHVEFDRVRGHLAAHHLAHFQFDVTVDDVVVENAACLEESAILVEIAESVAERATDGRDLFYFLWRQIV